MSSPLIAALLGADDAQREDALSGLSQVASDTFGQNATDFGALMRDSGCIPVLIDCMAHSELDIVQNAMSLLGNLLTDVFDVEARQSLALFVKGGGLNILQEKLEADFPINLFAAAAMQNITALDPVECCAVLREQGADAVLSTAASSDAAYDGADDVRKFAEGALANLRAYDPSPPADPDFEERLRLRRLMDVVEHMRSRRATDTMQFYGRRWIERHRAVKKLQARMRGSITRKAERMEVAQRHAAATKLQANYRRRLTQAEIAAERAAQAQAAALLQARARAASTSAPPSTCCGRGGGRRRAPAAAGSAGGACSAGGAAPPESKAEDAPAAAAAPSTSKEWVLVFGGGDAERKALTASLAARCFGSVVDLDALLQFARAASGDEAAGALLDKVASGGLMDAATVLPVCRRFMESAPRPFFVSGLFRMATQLPQYEAALGGLPIALLATGEPAKAADKVGSDRMAKEVGERLFAVPEAAASADGGDAIDAVVDALHAAGVQLGTPGSTSEDATATAAKEEKDDNEEEGAEAPPTAAPPPPPARLESKASSTVVAPPTKDAEAIIVFGEEAADARARRWRRVRRHGGDSGVSVRGGGGGDERGGSGASRDAAERRSAAAEGVPADGGARDGEPIRTVCVLRLPAHGGAGEAA